MSDPSTPPGTGVAPALQPGGLCVLLVDDEPPALSELAFLLRQDDRIGEIRTATSGGRSMRHEKLSFWLRRFQKAFLRASVSEWVFCHSA